MRRRRALLLAVLVYISLDLSMASMPGASMLDPAFSIENASVARGRVRVVDAVPHMPRADGSFALSQLRLDVTRRPAAAPVPPPFRQHGVTNRLPRAAVDPASPSEDPH